MKESDAVGIGVAESVGEKLLLLVGGMVTDGVGIIDAVGELVPLDLETEFEGDKVVEPLMPMLGVAVTISVVLNVSVGSVAVCAKDADGVGTVGLFDSEGEEVPTLLDLDADFDMDKLGDIVTDSLVGW